MIRQKIAMLLPLLIIALVSVVLAADETITLTTYYPSPFGVYDKLQTNKFAVGDTNNDGQLSELDQPNRNGDIRLQPQAGDPTNWPRGEEGQIAYSSTNDELYHSNGSSWVAQGSGSAVIQLSCAWGTDYRAGVDHGWDGSCVPQACPSGWTSTAVYSEPVSVACAGSGSCTWGRADGDVAHPVAAGRTVRICVK